LDPDLLILGAGGAGLCAALHAADASPRLRIGIVVKGLLGRAGCTRMVQGGYNAVLTPPDSLQAHLLDTLKGGGFINDQELVWTLVTEAPGRVLELESRYGCLFDRGTDDVSDLRGLGRQSLRRHRARVARGADAAGHGDDPVPPDRPRHSRVAHDGRAPRRGAARGRWSSQERPRRALHGPLRRLAHG